MCVWWREARTQEECLCQYQVIDAFIKVGIVCFLETNLSHLKVSPAWHLGEVGACLQGYEKGH